MKVRERYALNNFTTLLVTTIYRHYIAIPLKLTQQLQLASTVKISKKVSNRKAKTIKMKLKLPREPFTNLFEEKDIQKKCFDEWNSDIRSHDPLKDTREGVHFRYNQISKKWRSLKSKSSNQKLFPNKKIVAYWEVLTENTCFEISRW